MKKLNLLIVAIFIAIVFSSCSNRMLDFTIISSKNVILPVKKDAPRVKGKAANSVKGAVDNAIESAGTGYDALIDGVIYYTSYVYWIRYRVEGTPIKTSEMKNND